MTLSASLFKEIPLTKLRAELPKRKRQVQFGKYRIAATYYGQVVGFLVPIVDVQPLEAGEWISAEKTKEMSLTEFRSQLTLMWEQLQSDLDCVYLTFHTRRAAAFVTPRLITHLPIPKTDITSRLLTQELTDESMTLAETPIPFQ